MTAGEFWAWFEANEAQLRNAEVGRGGDGGAAFDELLARLRAHDGGLGYGVSPPREDGRSLVISADGCERLFPAVDAGGGGAGDPRTGGSWRSGRASGSGSRCGSRGRSFAPARMTLETINNIDGQGRLGLRLHAGAAGGAGGGGRGGGVAPAGDGAGERTCGQSELGGVEVVAGVLGRGGVSGHLPLTNLPTLLDWRRRRGRRVDAWSRAATCSWDSGHGDDETHFVAADDGDARGGACWRGCGR